MRREIPEAVPGADDEHLAAATRQLLKLPDLRAPDPDRFAQSVRALVETRAQSSWPNEGSDNTAVFVLVQQPRQVGQAHGAEAFVDLIAKNDPLLGRLFFATRDASFGRVMKMPVGDPNAILEWLSDNQLSDCPVVIVYRDAKKIISRRKGIEDIVTIDPIRDHPPTVTPSELSEALRLFHLIQMLTPSICPSGVWSKGRAAQYIPDSQPEKSIQTTLGTFLKGWFQGLANPEYEDKIDIGRIDIRLLVAADNNGPLMYWAIMELKIIKSFTSTEQGDQPTEVDRSANIAAIREGIRQASAFQKSRRAELGSLEIFDLRRNKTENLLQDPHVVSEKRDVQPIPECRVWPVYGSSKDARDAGYR